MQDTTSSINKNLPNSWGKSNISLFQAFASNTNPDNKGEKPQTATVSNTHFDENSLFKKCLLWFSKYICYLEGTLQENLRCQ